jgi:hypothetical protein
VVSGRGSVARQAELRVRRDGAAGCAPVVQLAASSTSRANPTAAAVVGGGAGAMGPTLDTRTTGAVEIERPQASHPLWGSPNPTPEGTDWVLGACHQPAGHHGSRKQFGDGKRVGEDGACGGQAFLGATRWPPPPRPLLVKSRLSSGRAGRRDAVVGGWARSPSCGLTSEMTREPADDQNLTHHF